MKRFLLLSLSLVCIGHTLFAIGGKIGNLTWNIDKDVLTISGKGDMPDFSDKEGLFDRPWDDYDGIKTLIIKEGVSSIGNDAFFLMGIEKVSFPHSLSHIGVGAFSWCFYLHSIYIPDEVMFIDSLAFNYCIGLEEIHLPKRLLGISGRMFEQCTFLTDLVIPLGVRYVDSDAFKDCNNLTVYATPTLNLSKSGLQPDQIKRISVEEVKLAYEQGNGKYIPSKKIQSHDSSSDHGIITTLRSDIDKNIPSSQTQNNSTIVLIIANENYHSMPQVPYAINDGNIFKEYCNKTLGIPEENILYQSNATLNGIRQKIDLLQKKAQARANARRETNIIVYYTGHGVPDMNTRGAYLMPTDGYEENISTGYKLDDLYQQLGKLPAKSITVFLDACFSGVNRNDEALAQNKGARLVAKSGMPVGNMVVFAASQGNQTAFVNDKEQHGLFTYYLLKKLQESNGDVTLDELANYLTSEVNLKSLDIHEKEQIPSIIASPQVQNQWQNWKLK